MDKTLYPNKTLKGTNTWNVGYITNNNRECIFITKQTNKTYPYKSLVESPFYHRDTLWQDYFWEGVKNRRKSYHLVLW